MTGTSGTVPITWTWLVGPDEQTPPLVAPVPTPSPSPVRLPGDSTG